MNFIIRRGDTPPLVSAGRGVIRFHYTIDADGNPVVTDVTQTSTPNLVHTTQLLCG